MAGIGITLDDLGIDGTSHNRAGYSSSRIVRKDSEYPKEYDFTLELALYGSWSAARDAMLAAMRSQVVELDLWISIFWPRAENETEDSIKERLTRMTYSKDLHDLFRDSLLTGCKELSGPPEAFARVMAIKGHKRTRLRRALARNENTPGPILRQLLREGTVQNAYLLLDNPALPEDIVRDIYKITRVHGAHGLFASAKALVPADLLASVVADILANRDPDPDPIVYDNYYLQRIAARPNVPEQTLIDMFGHLHHTWILESPSCTKRVTDEFDRLKPSGGFLLPIDRDRAALALKRVQSSIKTGRTAAIERRGGAELVLLNTVRTNPGTGIYEASCILVDDDF